MRRTQRKRKIQVGIYRRIDTTSLPELWPVRELEKNFLTEKNEELFLSRTEENCLETVCRKGWPNLEETMLYKLCASKEDKELEKKYMIRKWSILSGSRRKRKLERRETIEHVYFRSVNVNIRNPETINVWSKCIFNANPQIRVDTLLSYILNFFVPTKSFAYRYRYYV